MSLNEIIRVIVLLIIVIFFYYMSSLMTMRRNVKRVVEIFQKKKALSAKTAISGTKLDIWEESAFQKAARRRDDRAHAFKFLLDGMAVIATDDDSYYLDIEQLAELRKNLKFAARYMVPDIKK